MTFLLTAAVVALFLMLRDARRRLRLLERQVEDLSRPRSGATEPLPTSTKASAVAAVVADEDLGRPPLPTPERAASRLRRFPAFPVFRPTRAGRSPEPDRASAQATSRAPALRIGFEELFGRRLPIWAGGITLGVAGILLVKYSIDLGLLSPAVRVVLGVLFGAALIGGAEAALRQAERVGDPRVAQALAGAGVTSLFASVVAAANLYALIGPGTAFVGLAAVTALALALALRFGAPSALLGLVGGLAAPALVQSGEASVPLLSAYLGLTVAGLSGLALRRGWTWLGIGALLGGVGWSLVLIVAGALDWAATLSVGLLVVALGIAVPLLAFSGPRTSLVRGIAAVAAAAQMALLVSLGGFAMLHWGLYALLSLALLWLAGRLPKLRTVAATGLALGLFLAALWPGPRLTELASVLAGLALLYGGAALLRLWRPGGGVLEALQVAAVAVGGFAVAVFHARMPDSSRDSALALLALLAAALPASGAAQGWRHAARAADSRFAILATAAALLVAAAVALGLPAWLLAIGVAALSCGLLGLGGRAADRRLEAPALAFLAAAVLALVATADGASELLRAFGAEAESAIGQALVRWLAVALTAALLAWRISLPRARAPVQAAAALLGYGFVAQAVPAAWLGVACAVGVIAVAEAQRALDRRLMPALGALAVLLVLWALVPLAGWSAAAVASLGGVPVLVDALPAWTDAARVLVLPAALAGAALVRSGPRLTARERRAGWALVALLATAGVHTLYKQVFHLNSEADFVRLGLGERTVWEGLIVFAAFGAWRGLGRRGLAVGLATAGFAHQAWYSLVLHNPLWAEQAVGQLPLANWLVPAAAVAFASLWLVGRDPRTAPPAGTAALGLARMAVAALLAFASVRQLFAGPVPAGVPVSPGESIAWSVLAIALALGFLVWGIHARERVWRIGSLALMLVAVAKVFLIDAAGLEGLMRIASFLALGFSLIGLGWLYARFLRADVPARAPGSAKMGGAVAAKGQSHPGLDPAAQRK